MANRDVKIISIITLVLWLISSTVLKNEWVSRGTWLFDAIFLAQIVSALFCVLYIAGTSITSLLELVSRHLYRGSTRLLISLANGMFIVPAVVLTLAARKGYIYPDIIYAVYGLLMVLFIVLPNRNGSARQAISWLMIKGKMINNWPIMAALFIYLLVIGLTVTQYKHLPAMDTYSWTIAYEDVSRTYELDLSAGYARTLFSVAIQIIETTTKAGIYNIFKYIFPFMVVLLLPALDIIAKPIKPKWAKLLVLLAPLSSPVLIIEMETTRQQVMALFYLLMTAALLIETKKTKDTRLLMLAIVYGLIGMFYHPIFMIFIIALAIGMVWTWWKQIIKYKKYSIILLVAAYYFTRQTQLFVMIESIYAQLCTTINNFFHGRWNLKFPYSYRNSDGFDVGWSSISGVLKYYAYYAGPLILILLSLLGYWYVRDKQFRQKIGYYFRQPAYLTIILIFGFFLAIAEPIPRFANISYLPDRAWQFVDILSPVLLTLVMVNSSLSRPRMGATFRFVSAVAIMVGVVGIFIVNDGYARTMPEYEWQAAEWIRHNLPKERVILSSSSKNLLRYHAKSSRLHLERDFIVADDVNKLTDKIFLTVHQAPLSHPMLNDIKNKVAAIDDGISSFNAGIKAATAHATFKESQYMRDAAQEVSALRNEMKPHIDNLYSYIALMNEELSEKAKKSLPSIYIYYAKTDEKNPFNDRPYKSSFTGERTDEYFPAIEQHPEIFTLEYNNNNLVKIWRVNLPTNSPR